MINSNRVPVKIGGFFLDSDRKNYLECFISGSDDCTVRVWDQRHRASVVNMNAIYQVTAVSFGDASDQVVSAGIDNVVKVWDTRKPAQPVFQMAGHNG